jgi:putative endonuclease
MTRQYYVYIMAIISRVLYVGVTNDLRRRVEEHRGGWVEGFTRRYNVNRLVHFEATSDVRAALEREKELKSWRRSKKVALIEAGNPGWRDLSLERDEP